MNPIYEPIKRLIDITTSLVLAVLFLPIWIIIPILIVLDSKGTSFYTQKRMGKNGKIFKLYKFRTMKNGADKFWKSNTKLSNKARQSGWKLEINDDPRITKLGRFLRQTSIDEMPQVFNILKGNMSLVGPRPIREIEIKDALKRYGKKIQSYIDSSLTVKPGLTGPWQVAGRNDIPWNKRVRMDAAYAKRQSILEDLSIIIKTPFAMISKW
jgi:lipopolysaccharide/colanic/teichoic acid biosynthesis glycosyltransferase